MYSRNDRLKELYKELITRLLREVKDPGLTGFLTVTDLSLSVDRKTATVYYSILGSEAEREAAGKALLRAAPYLRVLLKKKVAVKVVPNIVFEYDETPRKASRIDELLNKLEQEKGA
ncbi:MAG TPA: 30S ribosome-binding factor RbfA [Elusimicrobia bacterium]|nr:MAG: ribosome-binding factor A [Elusimicrobia bacterium GWA2_66_18]OGR71026.1 MAG: ribosome-binding factor A [Elusimicrobia bacterium GWC2_65_9]HAZ08112.1 30S ribosome-binding factor RbfA [Elusimicrobiota bacterium]